MFRYEERSGRKGEDEDEDEDEGKKNTDGVPAAAS
jgi:hypothetical protein